MTRTDIYRETLRELFGPVAGLLFDDDSVTEVLINGPGTIYYERAGKLHLYPKPFGDGPPGDEKAGNAHALMTAVRNLAEYANRRVDGDRHSMDARFPAPELFRVHVILPPCSNVGRIVTVDGQTVLVKESVPVVSIRKFRRNNTQLSWLVENGSMSPAAAEYLKMVVKVRRNVVVAGGTGTGKTSLLNALSAEIEPDDRIVVIEDTSELQLQQPHTIYLESRAAGPDGKGHVTIRDLFVDSLRMRPDRILVGECRRGEALDLVQSMLSGHDGSLTTVHASAPDLALVRLETLCLMNELGMPIHVARTQVASAIQVVVQIARMPADGSRRVVAISEVLGLRPATQHADSGYRLRTIFRWGGSASRMPRKPTAPVTEDPGWTRRRSSFARLVSESDYGKEIALTQAIWDCQA